MARMLQGIQTPARHLERLRIDPETYRPERCPQRGTRDMHHYGYY